jgi:hypothetical protein
MQLMPLGSRHIQSSNGGGACPVEGLVHSMADQGFQTRGVAKSCWLVGGVLEKALQDLKVYLRLLYPK